MRFKLHITLKPLSIHYCLILNGVPLAAPWPRYQFHVCSDAMINEQFPARGLNYKTHNPLPLTMLGRASESWDWKHLEAMVAVWSGQGVAPWHFQMRCPPSCFTSSPHLEGEAKVPSLCCTHVRIEVQAAKYTSAVLSEFVLFKPLVQDVGDAGFTVIPISTYTYMNAWQPVLFSLKGRG